MAEREALSGIAPGTGDASQRQWSALAAHLRNWAQAEQGRGFLWAPVAVGAGAALYLTMPFEPAPGLAAVVGLVCSLLAVAAPRLHLPAAAAALIALGLASADLRTARLEGPRITREIGPTGVVGRLVSVEERDSGRRLIIAVETIDGLAPDELPARIRLTWKGKEFSAAPGERISLRAGLSPPPPPAAPGAFDLARQLYFQRIGGIGFAVTAPRRLEDPSPSFAERMSGRIERFRIALTARILSAAPGDGGAIVAASITGKRGAISAEAEAALRDSGLAHLVAISGLNMAIATGVVFYFIRLLLAAIEPVALRLPTKKIAAVFALAAGVLYLIISGGDWSAERAFIMTAIVFGAVLLDRRALSLRNIAIAALFILLTSPEAVIHPGFQMSFAAATALIAAYEFAAARQDPDRSFSLAARAGRYVVAVAATDVIASTATAPFSLFHFHRVALFGLPANVIAVPIMGLIVMPLAVLGAALVPFGIDGPVWRLAAAGVDVILAVARFVSAMPHAVATIPQWPAAGLVALTLGGLWLCLMRAPWRVAGLLAAPLATLIVAGSRPPQIFIAARGDNAGAIVDAGEGPALALVRPRKDRFAAEVWKEQVGLDAAKTQTLPMSRAGACDALGCVVAIEGARIAFSSDPMGLADDCARAGLVIALYPAGKAGRTCAARLVDRRATRRLGAHAIRIDAHGRIHVDSVGARRAGRPWSN